MPRVLNLSSNTIYAQMNQWSEKTCVCPDSLFFPGEPIVKDPYYYEEATCCPGGGGFNVLGQTGEEPKEIGLELFPNPFNPDITIDLYLGTSRQDYEVEVIDITGRRIRNLARGNANGAFQILWNGQGDQGKQHASGVYFIRARIGKATFVQRCILLK